VKVTAARSIQEWTQVLTCEGGTAMPLIRDHALNDYSSDNGGNRVTAGNVPVSDVEHRSAEQSAVAVECRIQGIDYLRDVEQGRLKKSHILALHKSDVR
jgi:hypothetical protein